MEPAERERYLNEHCGSDRDLRREVDALLSGDRSPHDFLDDTVLGARRERLEQAFDLKAQLRPVSLRESDVVGDYRLVRKLGEGGMGLVFEAEQDSPRRRVALKVLRPSSGLDSTLARFRHEAQVLGLLQHEGIAQIYEAGTFDLGQGEQPFFAMELVQGSTLLEWGRDRSRDERLRVIVKICEAVHYAHQKGVVHRDLKPDNILVTAAGQPKILDFGVARATNADLMLTTMHTDAGQLVGTVAYMSPEQASGETAELDARSDIYTLGVLLFELLAGRLPHEVSGRPIPEAVRTIQEEDPTRLRSLDSTLRGDLDTIVGHALEREPQRRYPSAEALGADVTRYLAHEPIQARPASAVYQISKFARRHRGLTLGLVVSMASLIAGLVASLTFALGEARLRKEADQQRREARSLAYRVTLSSADLALDRGRVSETATMLEAIPEEERGWEWHFYYAQIDPHLWSAATFDSDVRLVWNEPEAEVAFAAGGAKLVCGLDGRTVGVFDTTSGELLRRIDVGGALAAHLLSVSGQQALTVVGSRELVLLDLEAGGVLWREPFDLPVTAVALSDSGQVAAVGLDASDSEGNPAGELQRGAPGTWEVLHRSKHVPLQLDFADQDRSLLLIEDRLPEEPTINLTVSTLDALSGRTLAVFADSNPGHQVRGYTRSAAAARRAPQLLVGSAHQSVLTHRMDQVDPEAPVQSSNGRLSGHVASNVIDVSVTPDGRRAASLAEGGSVRVWDLEREEQLHSYRVERAASCALSPDGRYLAVNGDGELTVWDLQATHPRVLRGHETYVYYVDFSPHGEHLASMDFDQRLLLWDTASANLERELDPGAAKRDTPWHMIYTQFAWSADGHSIVAATPSALLRADLSSNRQFQRISEHDSQLDILREPAWSDFAGGRRSTPGCSFSPNDRYCVDLMRRNLVRLEDGRAWPLKGLFQPRSDEPELANQAASFSPDGSRVAVGAGAGIIYDVETAEPVGTLSSEGISRFYSVAWSPDGTRLATGSNDGDVRLWDARTYELIVILRGHQEYVHDVAWSPDGTQLASASGDGTVRLWDSLPARERHERAMLFARRQRELQETVEAQLATEGAAEVRDVLRTDNELSAEERRWALWQLGQLRTAAR